MALWSIERSDAVVVARYDNPPMGYFRAEGTQELGDLIAGWRESSVRAVVLTGGAPGRFITHYSVEELLALADDREACRAVGKSLSAAYHALLGSLCDLPIPVIAALSGDTMGGGFELSLACDIRIAEAGDFRIGLPEASLGILPGGSGTQRLSRLLGAGRALDFILRGRVCRPQEALAMGLVHEVARDACARAVELARALATHSPVSVSQIKRAVYLGSDLDLAAGLEVEADAFLQTMLSDEAVAAMREYVALPYEKRRDHLERLGALAHPEAGGDAR